MVINSENETEFHFFLNVIKEISAASERPDNQAILDHINETATNINGNHIDEIKSFMLEKQLIYGIPSKKGTSNYIMEQMNDNIDDNTTNNTNVDQITNRYKQFTETYHKYFKQR